LYMIDTGIYYGTKEVFVMPEYRKKVGSDTWHFCPQCKQWPDSNFDMKYTEPVSGEICNECRTRKDKGTCF